MLWELHNITNKRAEPEIWKTYCQIFSLESTVYLVYFLILWIFKVFTITGWQFSLVVLEVMQAVSLPRVHRGFALFSTSLFFLCVAQAHVDAGMNMSLVMYILLGTKVSRFVLPKSSMHFSNFEECIGPILFQYCLDVYWCAQLVQILCCIKKRKLKGANCKYE